MSESWIKFINLGFEKMYFFWSGLPSPKLGNF